MGYHNRKEEDVCMEMSNKRVLKNVIVISLVFMFNFTAYAGLSKLQSSLNRDAGMGVITQSLVYAMMSLTCLFIPNLVIRFLGHKWTMSFALIGYIIWMAANGYAVWGTMVTASIILGLCAAPLWTAKSAYFTIASVKYAKVNGDSTHTGAVSLFNGIFFMLFQLSSFFGSLISYTVLDERPENYTAPSDYEISLCGLNDCPWNNVTNENLARPSTSLVWTLVGTYITIAVTGMILCITAVDNLPKSWQDKRLQTTKQDVIASLTAGIKQVAQIKQVLLIPVTMYSGLEQGFFWADFNKSFVTCALGIHMVGLVAVPMGLTDALSSIVAGRLVKHIRQVPIIITGFCIDLGIQIALRLWYPDPSQEYVYFLIACLWGISDSVWQTQLNALYGVLFPKTAEAASSNYLLWESSGFITAFVCSSLLCTSTKLHILTTFLVLGVTCVMVLIITFKPYKVADIEIEAEKTKESTSPEGTYL